MNEELPKSVRRVQQALADAGITTQVIELPQSTRKASDAAAAIGCGVEQIAKSLIFRCTGSELPGSAVELGQRKHRGLTFWS